MAISSQTHYQNQVTNRQDHAFVWNKQKAYTLFSASTLAFIVSYMAWNILGVIGIPIRDSLHLNASQFALLIALPLFAGSLVRMPLGFLVDRLGGRIVTFILLLGSIFPVWLLSKASSYAQFLLLALIVGIIGGTYGVGIPYIVHWFPRHRQALVMSIYGAGSIGATLNNVLAPLLIGAFGWSIVPQCYAILLVVVSVIFWFFSYHDPDHVVSKKISLKEQFRVLKDFSVLCYCQYYAISSGAFMALSIWMVQYYVDEFHMTLGQGALFASFFTTAASILRILGGWFSDKYGGGGVTVGVTYACLFCLFFLSFPNTYVGMGSYTFYIGLTPALFTGFMFALGVAFSFGKASVYKLISDRYLSRMGAVSGIVGTAGSLAGSLWLIIFGALLDITGIRSTAFMVLFLMACFSLLLLRLEKSRQV